MNKKINPENKPYRVIEGQADISMSASENRLENKFDKKCQFLSQSDINEQGEEYRRLMFNKDNVEVVTYVNYL